MSRRGCPLLGAHEGREGKGYLLRCAHAHCAAPVRSHGETAGHHSQTTSHFVLEARSWEIFYSFEDNTTPHGTTQHHTVTQQSNKEEDRKKEQPLQK